MKKIFYLVFFITLYFLFNIEIKAEEGYCQYSLTRYSEGNGMFIFEDDDIASVKFKVDSSKKNKVTVEWDSNYDKDAIKKTDKMYQIFGPYGNLVNYKIDFSVDELYNKIIKGNEFSCPNLYGIYDANNFSLTIYQNDRVGVMGTSFVQLNLLKEQKPSNLEQEKLINQCGVGISDEKYGLPENMSIMFKKYTSRNEVCINYFEGASFCRNYIQGTELIISTEIALTTKSFIFEDKDLKKIFNNITANSAECINLWVDSNNVTEGVFRISTEKSNNGLDSEMTTGGYEEIVEFQQILDGTQFKNLLGSLRPPLETLSKEVLGDSFNVLDLTLTIDGNSVTLKNVPANDKLCSGSGCSDNSLYLTTQGLKDIVGYCNSLYEKYPLHKNDQNIKKRMDECIDFHQFYGNLVSKGIIQDLSQDCKIFSIQLKDKLVWFLDIIKIAGPLLALGLGTLDFIKTVASGDADKEMKNAFKRFSTRLIAAVLLFVIPFILAFLMDIFIGNQDGYDTDNPFCNIVDWGE